MKNRIKENSMKCLLRMFACAVAALFLAWTSSGSTELTIKTSEFNKAMRGEVAETTVTIKESFELKGANEKVSVGMKGVERGRDFALVLAGAYSKVLLESEIPFKIPLDNFTNKNPFRSSMAFKVEDINDKCPLMEIAVSCPASLALTGVVACAKTDKKEPAPMLCFDILPEKGVLRANELDEGLREAFLSYDIGGIVGMYMALDEMNLIDVSADDRKENHCRSIAREVLRCLAEISMANAKSEPYITFAIEGDDDKPIFVVGKEVKVDDKLVENYRAWIRKGDKVRIEANTKMRGNGVRFFETEAQADAAEPIAWK